MQYKKNCFVHYEELWSSKCWWWKLKKVTTTVNNSCVCVCARFFLIYVNFWNTNLLVQDSCNKEMMFIFYSFEVGCKKKMKEIHLVVVITFHWGKLSILFKYLMCVVDMIFFCVYGFCFKCVLGNQLFANHFCYAFATLILIVCFVLIWQQ